MPDVLELADRVEALEGRWRDAPLSLVDEVFSAVWPEPDRGPWYWRSGAWNKWNLVVWGIGKMHGEGNWLYLLDWLYRGEMPAMIHSDPKKAIAASLRAIAQEKGEAIERGDYRQEEQS